MSTELERNVRNIYSIVQSKLGQMELLNELLTARLFVHRIALDTAEPHTAARTRIRSLLSGRLSKKTPLPDLVSCQPQARTHTQSKTRAKVMLKAVLRSKGRSVPRLGTRRSAGNWLDHYNGSTTSRLKMNSPRDLRPGWSCCSALVDAWGRLEIFGSSFV